MRHDIVIVGGGIVGLATALELLQTAPKKRVLVLEKEDAIARHQTGHNSGVIHSGLYYKPGSLKAQNCIAGYHKLVKFCKEHAIPHELCGKIVVATSTDQIPLMQTLFERGTKNGLANLKMLNAEQLKEYEPNVSGVGGIYVPQTGIVDYATVSLKYAELIRELGGEIILSSKVIDIDVGQKSTVVKTTSGDYECELVINCAGLFSDKVARMTEQRLSMKIVPFRGEYYKIKKEREHLVKNLIYPVPDPNFPFLGVHFTRMIGGGVEAGPNAVLAYKREGYRKSDVDLKELLETLFWPGFQKVAFKYWRTGLMELYRSYSKTAFTSALQKLVPAISEDDLEPGHSGVRAQACDRTGGLLDDFKIINHQGTIHVCNAPSPAATSSLAIGETIAKLAQEQLNE